MDLLCDAINIFRPLNGNWANFLNFIKTLTEQKLKLTTIEEQKYSKEIKWWKDKLSVGEKSILFYAYSSFVLRFLERKLVVGDQF